MSRIFPLIFALPSSSFAYAAMAKVVSLFASSSGELAFSNMAGCLFDVGLFCVSVYVAKVKPAICLWAMGSVFGAFAVYHSVNYGEPCGCFGSNSYSTTSSIMFNGLFAIGLLWSGMFWKLDDSKIVVGFLLVLAGFVVLDQTIENTASEQGKLIDFRLLEGEPVVSLAIEGLDISSGTWKLWLLDKNCKSCLDLADTIVPQPMQYYRYDADSHGVSRYFVICQGDMFGTIVLRDLLLIGTNADDLVLIPAFVFVDSGRIARVNSVTRH